MKKLTLFLGAVALWPAGVCAQSSLADDAAAFGARTSIRSVDLSLDGKKIVYVESGGGAALSAKVADLETGSIRSFLEAAGGTDELSSCGFVTNARLICQYRATVKEGGMLIGFSRLIAINSDGSNIKLLGQRGTAFDNRIRQFDGSIIDWLPDQGGSILMARDYVPESTRTNTRIFRTEDGIGVDRVDTATLVAKSVEKPRKGVSGYMTDGRGKVRLMVMEESDERGELTGRVRVDYRTSASSSWKTLSPYGGEELVPLAIDSTTDSLYALKKLHGRYALYRITLTDPVATTLVASHPKVDIDDVVRSANGQRVIGYTLVEEMRQTVYFDPEYKALKEQLSKALPKLPLINFVASSADGAKTVVFAGSDNDPGRYYLFDKNARKLEVLLSLRPQLKGRTLASVKPVNVRVSDGTMVPAYLTLPVGKEARNLPAVVLPHGGPSSRDEWGFDWLAQFLAARGYAVIQPNYRGSAGFGDQWLMDNGFKNWRTSIGDITESIKWLVSEGIADRNRLAVVGWSYGGYAALQAAAVEPGLFKAVAAIAPVTDLALMKEESSGYTSKMLVHDFVGSGPHVQDGSPLRRASAIKAPVVLVHGDMDSNVGVQHSLRMESALRSGGTPVELLRYGSLDHQLEDSKARHDMLTKIGQLLERTIGR